MLGSTWTVWRPRNKKGPRVTRRRVHIRHSVSTLKSTKGAKGNNRKPKDSQKTCQNICHRLYLQVQSLGGTFSTWGIAEESAELPSEKVTWVALLCVLGPPMVFLGGPQLRVTPDHANDTHEQILRDNSAKLSESCTWPPLPCCCRNYWCRKQSSTTITGSLFFKCLESGNHVFG